MSNKNYQEAIKEAAEILDKHFVGASSNSNNNDKEKKGPVVKKTKEK